MKLKNTLGIVIGSLVAATSLGALAQGQGSVEVDAFAKRYFADSTHDITNGNLFGGSLGYFLTDDLSLNLSHGVYKSLEGEGLARGQEIDGHLTGLEAVYHFGTPGVRSLRPYVSAGFAHQELDNTYERGQNKSTLATLGTGVKYYVSENVLLKAGLDMMHGLDQEQTEWMAGVGVGMNFGGGRQAPAPAPVAAEPLPVVEQPAPVSEPVPEVVRVELDVKFDFDKAQVKPESYTDIQNLAEFMNQYPQTTTVVEGHTDAVGTDAYNQKLSERRAAAVRQVLVNQYGVEAGRVNSVGYGESRPVADNATDAGRAINRRVEAEVEAQIKR